MAPAVVVRFWARQRDAWAVGAPTCAILGLTASSCVVQRDEFGPFPRSDQADKRLDAVSGVPVGEKKATLRATRTRKIALSVATKVCMR